MDLLLPFRFKFSCVAHNMQRASACGANNKQVQRQQRKSWALLEVSKIYLVYIDSFIISAGQLAVWLGSNAKARTNQLPLASPPRFYSFFCSGSAGRAEPFNEARKKLIQTIRMASKIHKTQYLLLTTHSRTEWLGTACSCLKTIRIDCLTRSQPIN